eukprot:8006681-Pyramimonas_sp.AAC.1
MSVPSKPSANIPWGELNSPVGKRLIIEGLMSVWSPTCPQHNGPQVGEATVTADQSDTGIYYGYILTADQSRWLA